MDNKLLELLYCPVTQTRLEYDREAQVLISKTAQLVFPIRDGIPIMLESEAITLDTWRKDRQDEQKKTSAPATSTTTTPPPQKKSLQKKVASKKSSARKTSVKKQTQAEK